MRSVPADTRCWLQRPRIEDKTYTYSGEVRSKRVVALDQPPCMVAALTVRLPAAYLSTLIRCKRI